MMYGNWCYIEDASKVDKAYQMLHDSIRHHFKHGKLRRKLRGHRYKIEFQKIVHEPDIFTPYGTVACKCIITKNK